MLKKWKNTVGCEADAVIFQPTGEVTEAEFDKVMTVNVKSVYWSASIIVPYMQQKKIAGSFVVTASTAGIRPRGGL